MGPPLLLDKSGIQSLPQRLVPALSRYYVLVVPPILLQEILGDLLKPRQGGHQWMRMLVEKIPSTQSFVNMDHRDLRLGSLLGKPIPMDGRPVVATQEFETPLGTIALGAETKEHSQLSRWKFEQPSALDEQSAREWRDTIRSVDLEKSKAYLKALSLEMPRVRSFAELDAAVDMLLRCGDQGILLEMCLEDGHIDEESRRQSRARWTQVQAPPLSSFAPYAFFCFRIRMLFHIGLVNDLVSTKSSNTADLLYLYYVPFCSVFSSNDRLHEDLAPLILRPDQCFIRTSVLRADLDAIERFWDHLTASEKRMWCDRFGDRPPRNTGSFTYRRWSRTMVLPAGLEPGNILRTMSPGAKTKMTGHVREVMKHNKDIQERIKSRKTEDHNL